MTEVLRPSPSPPPSPPQYQRPNYPQAQSPQQGGQQPQQSVRPRPVTVVRSPNSGGQSQALRHVGQQQQRLVSVKRNLDNDSVFASLLGFGTRDYAWGPIPRGYGLTLVSIAGCYGLLRWERNRIEKTKKKPPFMATNIWFSKLKTAEREYLLARGDFPRVTMLMLIGGLALPYAAAIGGVFWFTGRAIDFHEKGSSATTLMEKRAANDFTEPFFCRFGKFLMICGICKLFFDVARGRLSTKI